MKNINYKIGDKVNYNGVWVNGTGHTFFEGVINNVINEQEHIYEVKRLDDGSLWKVTDCDEQEELKKIGSGFGYVVFLELANDNNHHKKS
jgi:ribosomal protein L21E